MLQSCPVSFAKLELEHQSNACPPRRRRTNSRLVWLSAYAFVIVVVVHVCAAHASPAHKRATQPLVTTYNDGPTTGWQQ